MIQRRLKRALAWRLKAVTSRLDAVTMRLDTIEQDLKSVDEKLAQLGGSVDAVQASASPLPHLSKEVAAIRAAIDERVQPMLRVIVDEEPDNRRMLYKLRADPAYQSAYTDPDPLVSIVVATLGRPELVNRALPSLLSQSHTNLEILVAGDHARPEVEAAIRDLGDPRVHYSNLSQRLVAHADPRRSWLVGSTMARNEAARRARGQWLLYFDDDDRLRPGSIARLLTVAREQRAEVSYGGFEQHEPEGGSTSHSAFPPQWGQFAWPAALVHSGLRFFERELVATHLDLPGDMYMLMRMLRVGVRFAMLDEVVLDYFPSSLWEASEVVDQPGVLASLTHHGPVPYHADASRDGPEPLDVGLAQAPTPLGKQPDSAAQKQRNRA